LKRAVVIQLCTNVERYKKGRRVDELQYWSEKFGVSKDELKAAVQKVGTILMTLPVSLASDAW
jgi:hypothetical protein